MNKARTSLIVGAFVLLSASTIYSLTPDRFIQALPSWAKVVGVCVLALGICFELICAVADLRGPKAKLVSEKKPNQPPEPTR